LTAPHTSDFARFSLTSDGVNRGEESENPCQSKLYGHHRENISRRNAIDRLNDRALIAFLQSPNGMAVALRESPQVKWHANKLMRVV
jgi:hypothetical protein